MERLMGSLEELSVAIGQLSCLDRMVDRGRPQHGPLDRDETERRSGTLTTRRMWTGRWRISRRSTMSNATESTQILEADTDYVERMSQRTLV